METNEFIADKGLFLGQADFNFSLPDSFETIMNFQKTIKEYRDYAHPDSPEWQEYIQEIFHVLGFETKQEAPRLISLIDIGAQASPKALVMLVSPGENFNEIIPGLDWLSYLRFAASFHQVNWGFLTNGLEMQVFDFRRKDYLTIFFQANLDGIITEGRLDSFFTIYKIFAYIRDVKKETVSITQTAAKTKMKGEAKASGSISKSTIEMWNGRDYYVSFGECETRNWEDARKYGFVSAGGGRWYSKTLSILTPGSRVFVCVPKAGYVGVGIIKDAPVSVNDLLVEVEGKQMPIIEAPLKAAKIGENSDNPDLCEYLVRVDWIKTIPVHEAIWEKGMYANQNSATKLRHRFTLDVVTEMFGVAK